MTVSTPIVMTSADLVGTLERDITTDQSSISTLESQVASGRSVSLASTDPIEASNILRLSSGVERAKQYSANAQAGVSRLSLANTTASSVLDVLEQAQSAVEGLTGYEASGSTSAIAGVSSVVTSARQELIDLANTQYAGQAIFSGTGTPQRAYDATGAYVGAGTAPTVTVSSGTKVAVSVTGPAIFGPTGPTSLLGPTGVLATISADLAGGNVDKAATTGLSALQAAITRVEEQSANLGADYQSVEGFSSQATGALQALQDELSGTEDVTMAVAATNLQNQQTAYEAALSVISDLKTDSLVNYL